MPPRASLPFVNRAPVFALALAAVLTPTLTATAQAPPLRRISRAVLEDKVRGGWAGQMIGVSYGAPTEFRSNGSIIEGNLRDYLDWTPARLENALDQDDLYVEMTFAEVMDTVGLEATTEQYGEMFKSSQYQLWHANAAARRLLNQGIKAPMSGHPKHNLHSDDIDFQIESDFIGPSRRVTAGHHNLRCRIHSPDPPDRLTRRLVSAGRYRTGVDDNDFGFFGRNRGAASPPETVLDGHRVCLVDPATEGDHRILHAWAVVEKHTRRQLATVDELKLFGRCPFDIACPETRSERRLSKRVRWLRKNRRLAR